MEERLVRRYKNEIESIHFSSGEDMRMKLNQLIFLGKGNRWMQEGREEVGGWAEGDDEKWQEGIEGQGIHGLFKEFDISIEHGIEGTFIFCTKWSKY